MNDTEGETETWVLREVVPVVVPIIFGIIVTVGLFGNGLVVLVVSCNLQMRSTTNLLIINLAVADLLFIIFCVPFTATDYAMKIWVFGDAWCKIVQYVVFVTAYASVFTLVLMSMDRFLAVVLPIASMGIRTERNAGLAILCTWSVILVACVPIMLSHGEVQHYDNSTAVSCMFLDSQLSQVPEGQGYNYPAFQLTFFATSYVLPLLVIIAMYLLLLKRLWLGVVPGGNMSAESLRGKRRVTRMVVVVVVIFAVCWCPIQIILVVRSLNKYPITDASVLIQIVAQVQAYTNSCINPILYAFLSENFRKAFFKVIYCAPRQPAAVVGRPQRASEMRPLNETKTTRSTLVNGNKESMHIL
ncbi:Allatostatin-A receptor [Amphibalanus amphitrite]|uniref:Allatostatin-A receptor n=1 Tax=Amphibalanus amphitrite TaxID=1232801 RepID=A0A6A4WEN0_AMPAM|nr:allatostatin-A receptor-like [Amphibalanus amphitrite]KAF0300431.1 Allatostatin-A receptor [Amphibalanus amphitrite]